MRVLFLAPYPAYESPSQRYRFEHYLPYLIENGISYSYKPFLSEQTWNIFFKPGNILKKGTGVLGGCFKRALQLFTVSKFDYVFIHREAAPIGPPVFEWIITKVLGKKVIYDFDDAIWIPATSSYNKTASMLKNFSKVAKICKWAHKVSVGNHFLQTFAKKYNANVFIIPTVVDTVNVHNQLQIQNTNKPAIGWTGTFSTLKYLDIVLPVLQQLQNEINFVFIVIADKDPELPLKNYQFIKWSQETETLDLLNFHIGIMPLYNDEISKGKCGFKAIQYMALGIPAVVSPVGVNSEIVEDGINGFVVDLDINWKNALKKLLQDPTLRDIMGEKSRERILHRYSVVATKELFFNLFLDKSK